MLGGGTSNDFAFGMVVFAVAIVFLMPTFISVFIEKTDDDSAADNIQDVLDGYIQFTGSVPTSESVWALTGIYTPVGVDANGDPTNSYGYTPDHWIYGSRISTYKPTQFDGTASEYTATYDNGFYFYNNNTIDGHTSGQLYTSVSMDTAQKSDIFFTPSGKRVNGENWYYDYTGYRYSFQPLSDYYYKNTNGDIVKTTASTTSLSMIWYDYYGSQGLSSQMVLSGSDSGVAYLTSAEIVSAFNSANNIAKFQMVFNGNDMNVYIKIRNEYTTLGYSVAECFDFGYWDIMITSVSTNIQTYISTDYSVNIYSIWDTFIDLFTFNMDDYNLSPEMQLVCSVTISVVLYAGLIALGLTCYPILLIAGAVAIFQTLASTQIEIPDLWPWW